MDLQDFRNDFIQAVRSRAEAERDFIPSAFVEEAAVRLADADEIADFVPCHFRGTGARQRHVSVDGYAFDESDNCLRLLIGSWSGAREAPRLTQTDATRLFGQARGFLEDAFSGRLDQIEASAPASELVSLLHDQREFISSFRIYLVTDSILSSRIKDWPEGVVDRKPIESHIWDISRFLRAFESRSGRDELVIDFSQANGKGIAALPASHPNTRYKSYMCVLPGAILASMYNNFGSRLLEGNVRAFLSLRGAVNKGIRQTILNEPEMFFAYNNGITVVASEVGLSKEGEGLRLLWARDLQIVNGGQTTASLAMAVRNDEAKLESVLVQMKLSVIPAGESTEIIPKISRYANSQNKVSDADFFSNHEFHRRMEEISRRIWAPSLGGQQYNTHWFYERARGQYVTELAKLRPADRARFELLNPRKQLVTKTDFAKFENSWLRIPHQVSKGAQKNFLTFAERVTDVWDEYQSGFDETFFKRAIAKGILFKTLEKTVPGEDWFEGDFRAQIVTYSVAKLSSMTEEATEHTLDWEGIWRKQALSPALLEQSRLVARAVSRIVSSPPRGTRNVSEWCKKQDCWETVREAGIPLRAGLRAELKRIRRR
jgi:hypothetical protein